MRNILWWIAFVLAGCGQSATTKAGGSANQSPSPSGPVIRVPQDATTPALGFQLATARRITTVLLDGVVFSTSRGNVTFPIDVPRGFTLEGRPGATLDGEGGANSSTPLVSLDSDTTIRGITVIDTAYRFDYVVKSTGTKNVTIENCKLVTTMGVSLSTVTNGVIRSTVIHLPSALYGSGGRGIEIVGCVDPTIERNTIVYLTKAIVWASTSGLKMWENIIAYSDVGVTSSGNMGGEIAYNMNATSTPYLLNNGRIFKPFPGTNELVGTPGFVNRDLQNPSFDLRLAPVSACRTNGKTGGPIGALGTIDYRTTFSAATNAQSPPTGTYARSSNTVILIFDLIAGSGGPAILNVGDMIGFGGFQPSGRSLGTPTLSEGGIVVATHAYSSASSVFLKVSRRIEIQAGTTRTFTLTGDTTPFTPGDRIFLVGNSISWSDGVIPTIDDGITPVGTFLSGILTFN